jgi:ribonuclease III
VACVAELVGYRFRNTSMLLQALTHSSFSNERCALDPEAEPLPDNERLEFLGDAVIGLLIAEKLMMLFPDASEGKLSRWRSSLVSRKTLAEIALHLGLGDLVLLGRGERQTGGAEKRSILAAVLEALVGAIYLDGGLEAVATFLINVYRPLFAELESGDDSMLKLMDKKTHLQERTQSLYKAAPLYRLVEAWGPEHEKVFRVEIIIDGRVVARGDGRSKKDAEQQAASIALELLGF